MNDDLRIKALKQLAQTAGDKIQKALEKEGDNVAKILGETTQYDIIESSLQLLDSFAHRISDKAVIILKDLLTRLHSIEITYQGVEGPPSGWYKDFQSANSLTIKVLEKLGRLRYHQQDEVFDILLEHSIHEDKKVADKAVEALKHLAEYDIDIVCGRDEWKGLGLSPQNSIIDALYRFSEEDCLKYLEAVTNICTELLSPTMRANDWNYASVTLRTSNIPDSKEIREIRYKVIDLVRIIYKTELTLEQKVKLLNVLGAGTKLNSQHNTEGAMAAVLESTREVLDFLVEISADDNLMILQKIEYNAYWLLYHSGHEESIAEAVERIKKNLDENPEYQICKVLVGFEGVFDWDIERETNFSEIEELRTTKSQEYAESISEENYPEWEARILGYSKIESEDLATFPYFRKFLEAFAVNTPDLALGFLRKNADSLESFLVSLLLGLWKSDRQAILELLDTWIEEGKFLRQVSRMFTFNAEFDENIMRQVLSKSQEQKDINSLICVISVSRFR